MALIRTSRSHARSGRAAFVPGGLACAAAARRLVLTPTLLEISSTLKLAPGFAIRPVTRLAAGPA